MLTDTGAPLKIVVRCETAIYTEPKEGSGSQPVRMFEFFYAMPVADNSNDKLKDGFYRIARSPRKSAIVGWIKADDVVEWPHRQIVGFRQASDRAPVYFFQSLEDLQGFYNNKQAGSMRPLSREPADFQKALMPLLEVVNLKVDGDDVTAYRVAYLHRAAGAASAASGSSFAASPGGASTGTDLQKNFTLDIVFVVDTTRSMQPWIDAVKQVIAEVAKLIDQDAILAPRVRLGLVAYRDVIAGSGMEYGTKIVCDLPTGKDHSEFQRRLNEVHEAEVGSEDYAEEMLAGLHVAVKDSGCDAQSYKIIFLIGDASAHLNTDGSKNPGRLTIPGILAEAQPAGAPIEKKILINGMRIANGSGDEPVCKEHFTLLTAGRDFSGFHHEYRERADADRFIQKLMESLKTMSQVTGDLARGDVEKVKQQGQQAKAGSDESLLLGPVLVRLHASESDNDALTSFASGYVCSIDPNGNLAIEPYVMVTKGRMSLFGSALDFTVKSLDGAGDPGSKDVQRIVKSLQVLATQINMAEPIDPELPVSKFLSLVLGIPVKSPIFEMTPRKLAAMPERDYQAWVAQVRGVEGIIKAHLENASIWTQLGDRTARDQDRIGFIKVNDLP